MALAIVALLAIAGCAMASVNASHGDKGDKGSKTYPLYVNGSQVSDDSLTVDGIDIAINPGPAKDGNFYNGTTVTLESAIDMLWARDCGSSYIGDSCSVVMDQDRNVEVSQMPPPTPTPTPVPPTDTPPPPTDTPPPDDGSDGGSGDDGGSGGGSDPPALADITNPQENQLFSVRIGEQIAIPIQTTAYPDPLWCFLSTRPSTMTLNDTECVIRWTPGSNYTIGQQYEVTFYIKDTPPGQQGREKYGRFFIEVLAADDDPPDNPPPPDDDPCAISQGNGFVASLLGLLDIGKDMKTQQCVGPPNIAVTSSVCITNNLVQISCNEFSQDTFGMGQTLYGMFTIVNNGSTAVTMDLVLGGRLNGDDTCNNYPGGCPDFAAISGITLQPGASYAYDTTFVPQLPGSYRFQVFFQANGQWYWNLGTENGANNNMTVEITGLAFPLDKGTPYTARVVAVFDNDRATGVVRAYNGDIGSVEPLDLGNGVVGYKKAGGGSFDFPLIYYDDAETIPGVNEYLFYDNHTGYDYGNPVVAGDTVRAALGGTLCLPTDKTSGDGTNIWRNSSKCPVIDNVLHVSGTTQWDKYHVAYIIHPGGFSTWYVHIDSANTEGLEENVRNQIVQNGYATVTRNQHIAYAGKRGTAGVHLHFGVRSGDTLIDPYGKGGNPSQEVLWEDPPPQ